MPMQWVFSFILRLPRLGSSSGSSATPAKSRPPGLSVAALRADTARYASRLEVQAHNGFSAWLASISL